MSTLIERLNMSAGEVELGTSAQPMIFNKRDATFQQIMEIVDNYLFDLGEDSADDSIQITEIVMGFGSAAELPYGGLMSIWFDKE